MNDQSPAVTNETADNLDDLYCDTRNYEPDLHWNYAAKGILCRGETSVLYGPSNSGKSALVCHLGNCIVTGTKFFGANVQKGTVIHVCAEAPKSVLERVHAYKSSKDAAPYIVRIAGVDLSNRADVDRFLDELRCLIAESCEDIILIVFDTLARSIGDLDENCSSSMTAVADTLEYIATALNAHAMLVHHTGKDAERGGRGSSALRGAVFTEVALKPEESRVIVTQEKQRSMPKAPPVQFKIKPVVIGKDEDGDDRTTVHIEEIDGKVADLRSKGHSKSPDACETAVLTALHIRPMMGKISSEPFRPRDVLSTLPPELFGTIEEESRIKNVSRSLVKLAERQPPLVEKVTDGWRLVPTLVETVTSKK